MNEAALSTKFRKVLRARWPTGWVYKIPDTAGLGGKRPFDIVAIIKGKTFCIETKRDNIEIVTPWQLYNLELARENGAYILVVNYNNMWESIGRMEEIIYGRK